MKPEPNHEKSSHFKMEDCSVCPSDSGTSDPANPPALKKALFQKKTVYRLAALAAVAAVVLAGSDFFGVQKNPASSQESGAIASLNLTSDILAAGQETTNLHIVEMPSQTLTIPEPGTLAAELSAYQMKDLEQFLQGGASVYFSGEAAETKKGQLLEELAAILPRMEADPVYSMYNPNTSEHLFTTNPEEQKNLSRLGWRDEGICFGSSKTDGIPVYRLYLKKTDEHLYTSSKAEAAALVKNGWIDEGAKFFASSLHAKPVIRLLNPNQPGGLHHFTSDPVEVEALEKAGWIKEGTAFQVIEPLSFENQTINGQRGLVAMDSAGNSLTGLVKLRTGAYYFDPDQSGFMAAGWLASPSPSAETMDMRYFKETGKMATGAIEFADGHRYFDKTSGIQLKDQFIRQGNPKKTYYYDENGLRAAGELTIRGRTMDFDVDTGVLKQDLHALLDQCVNLIKKRSGSNEDFSLALRLPESDEYVSWNNHSQQSASVMKLFVMAAIFDDYDTYCKRYGQNVIDSNLNAMITVSDNDAWAFLTAALANGDFGQGTEALKAWCQKHGYGQTWMENRSYGNFTSVRDASKILQDIYLGKLSHSVQMKELIKRQAIPGRLLAGIPENVTTGNKGGWLDDTQNDSVIVWLDQGTYILTLMSTDLASIGNAQQIMKDVSTLVYEWMQTNLKGTVRNESAGIRPDEDGPNEIEAPAGTILIELAADDTACGLKAQNASGLQNRNQSVWIVEEAVDEALAGGKELLTDPGQ